MFFVAMLVLSVDSKSQDLFDDGITPLSSTQDLPSWAALLDRIEEQRDGVNQCIAEATSCEGRRMRSVNLLVQKASKLSTEQQVRLVNRYINKFSRYRDDRRRVVAFGETSLKVGQEWSTLVDFLARGGDCEDYATAKYQLLRMLGFPATGLRVVVVYDRREREHHAIVAVANVAKGVLFLDTDNQTYSKRPVRYRFIFALNEEHIWDFGVSDTRLSWTVRRALKKVQNSTD